MNPVSELIWVDALKQMTISVLYELADPKAWAGHPADVIAERILLVRSEIRRRSHSARRTDTADSTPEGMGPF